MALKTAEERASSYSLENPNTPLAKALMFLGGERTVTGRSMNDGAAMALPAFWNGVQIISGDMGTVPLKIYRKENGGRVEENGHPLWDMLTLSPTEMVTSSAWRQAMQGHLLLRGNCYTEIVANRRGRVTDLVPHSPDSVERRGSFYKIVPEQRMVPAGSMLHIAGPGGNGVDGYSVIKLARENLALAGALEESNARFIANASRPSGFLTSPNPVAPEALKRIKDMWGSRNSGLDNVGRTPVLDNAFTWQQVGMSAEDTQYIESRSFSVIDIARWLNIPPHKIKDLERSTFSNVEQQSIDYVTGTVRPWAVTWEQCLNLKLLTPKERAQGLYIEFNLDGLLRGDIATRTEAYRTQFDMGMLTPNEGRNLENRNPIGGGDSAYVRLDMVPLDLAAQAAAANIAGPQENTEERTTQRTEFRSHDGRILLRSAFTALLLDAAGRMVRGEVRNILRILKRSQSLNSDLEAYYFDEHPGFAETVMGPVFRSYAESVAAAAAAEVDTDNKIDAKAFADAYLEGFVARYSARSRRDLVGREPEDIEMRLQEWTEGTANAEPRPAAVASQEVIKLGDAVARQAFVAGGVFTLVWRTLGDSCPYCVRLNGRTVGVGSNFIEAGENFEGEGTDVVLTPKNNIGHAPAHRGCNCTIVPGTGRSAQGEPIEQRQVAQPTINSTPVTVNVTIPPEERKSPGAMRFIRNADGAIEAIEPEHTIGAMTVVRGADGAIEALEPAND